MKWVHSGGSSVGSVCLLETPCESKLFHLHGALYEKLGKLIKSKSP